MTDFVPDQKCPTCGNLKREYGGVCSCAPEPRLHNGHLATCLCCQLISVSDNTPYSDETPGDGLGFNCYQRVFIMLDKDEFHTKQYTAQVCRYFKPQL